MIDNMFDYFKTNKDAFTSIGVLITFFVSSFSLYFSVRNNKAVHYVNSITKSRIEWIQKLRSTVAEFIANTNIYNNAYYKGDYIKAGIQLSKCQQLCSEIKLLLNYCDKKDKEIIELTDIILKAYVNYYDCVHNTKTDKDGYFVETSNMKRYINEVEENIGILSKKVQIYLKAEWNRVKYESQGKVYEKDTQEYDYEELEKQYEDSTYKSNVWEKFAINSKAKIIRIITSPGFVIPILMLIMIVIVA